MPPGSAHVAIAIRRFVDDHFPGFVECELVDAHGIPHRFVEKLPIVTAASLWPDSMFPQPGALACEIEATWDDLDGRRLVRICTDRPHGVASIAGATDFVVLASQLTNA